MPPTIVLTGRYWLRPDAPEILDIETKPLRFDSINKLSPDTYTDKPPNLMLLTIFLGKVYPKRILARFK